MRKIPSAGNLSAQVEGDVEEVDGVLKITRIRLRYLIRIAYGSPPDIREKIDRALQSYADQCPAYQSVKGCIDCSWETQVEEADQ